MRSLPVFEFWDWVLIGVVALQATVVAYVHSPRVKAFIMFFPVVFTVAVVAVGKPVDAANIAGLGLLYLYSWTSRICHYRWHIPIVPSIMLSAFLYCLEAVLLIGFIPSTDWAFWTSCSVAIALALLLLRVRKPQPGTGHTTPLPVWIKLPAVTAIVVVLVAVKVALQGFLSTAPMVALFGTYEARKSLYALTNQIPLTVLLVTMISAVSRLTYRACGLGPSLLLGWSVCALTIGATVLWSKNRVGLPLRREP